MASLYDIKPRFQAILRPQVDRLAGAGITANMITIAALGLSVVYGLAIAAWPFSTVLLLGLPVVLLIRMMLNAADGMLAREHDQKTRLGMVLNESGDLVSDAALYLPLAISFAAPSWMVVVLVMLALVGEAIGMLGPTLGGDRRYDGPFGKADRALAFGALAILTALGWATWVWVPVVLGVLIALAIATIVNRARKVIA
ncbi:MAG: CDP-alcohol phosphatidyltransferase family protein [Pseudomonadota bacterium]